jgi:hypothetical protein
MIKVCHGVIILFKGPSYLLLYVHFLSLGRYKNPRFIWSKTVGVYFTTNSQAPNIILEGLFTLSDMHKKVKRNY